MFRPFRGNAGRGNSHIIWETSSASSAGSSIRARLANRQHLIYRSNDSASGNSSLATPSDLSTPHSLATPTSQNLTTPTKSSRATDTPQELASAMNTPNGPLLTPGDGAAHLAPTPLHTPEFGCLPAPGGKCQTLPALEESPVSQSEAPAFHLDAADEWPASSAAPDGASGDGEAAELPSLGARLHDSGECTPCAYVNAKDGCASGRQCAFCHSPHVKKSRKRPSKNLRTQTKHIVNLLEAVDDPNQKIAMAKELSAVSPYFRDVIAGKYGEGVSMASGSNEGTLAQPTEAFEEILPI